jgi:hypothetical protein
MREYSFRGSGRLLSSFRTAVLTLAFRELFDELLSISSGS